jgi:hypothetical protein
VLRSRSRFGIVLGWARQGVDSPWESPTHLDRSSFAVDALVWLLVLLVAFIVIRGLVRRRAPAR